MKTSKMVLFTVGILLAAIILSLFAPVSVPAHAQGSCNACADEHCAKIGSAPWTFDVQAWGANASYIRRVEIKAGSGDGACTLFTEDGNNGCYAVTGIGGKVASVSKVGAGPACKDISHVLFYWWSPTLPTFTPTPTDAPTSTPTSTPTDTPVPTVTNTPPPNSTPTPTLPPRDTPTPTAPVPTLTLPPLPSPTPQDTPTATPTRPAPKQGTMRGYLQCVHSDGSIGLGYGELQIVTNNIGVVGGYSWPPDGYVGTWSTARDIGTTVLSAGPGECFRGGDNWPADLTEYNLAAQPIFGAGNVGNSAVVCRQDCVDTSTFYLPQSGESFTVWFVNTVLQVLRAWNG